MTGKELPTIFTEADGIGGWVSNTDDDGKKFWGLPLQNAILARPKRYQKHRKSLHGLADG